MSENEFLNALKEEMPEGFGRELLAQLKAEDKKQKVTPFPTFWTVAVASIVTVLVGFVLFFSRMPDAAPLSLAMQAWQSRDPITAENINLAEPLLTIGQGQAQAIALSPDNNTLAVATSMGIYLHDAHNLSAEARFLGLPSEITFDARYNTRFYYLEYTPDGRLFALMVKSNELRLYQWDEESQTYLSLYSLGQPWLIPQVADISPDGTKLLLGACSIQENHGNFCQNGTLARIQIVDLVNGGNIFYRVPIQTANAIAAVNPDWTQLAFQEDHQIKLYDMESSETQVLMTIEEGQYSEYQPWDEMHHIYFSPDGQRIGILDNSTAPMDWWEISALQNEALTVPAFGNDFNAYVNDMPPATALHPSLDEYVIGTSAGFQIFSYFGTGAIATFPSDSLAVNFVISSELDYLYTLDKSGLIQRWNWDNQSLSESSLRYTTGSSSSFRMSADSRSFAAYGYAYSNDWSYLYELAPSGLEQTFLSGEGHYPYLEPNVAISQDGHYVAYSESGEIWLYLPQEERRLLLNSNVKTRHLVFRNDGALIAFSYATDDFMRTTGTVSIYTPEMLETGIISSEEFTAIEGISFYSYEFSPDGTKLLFRDCEIDNPMNGTCENLQMRIFDTFTWEEIASLETDYIENSWDAVGGFSPDSQWYYLSYCSTSSGICDGGEYLLQIWNMAEIANDASASVSLDYTGFELAWVTNILPNNDGSFLIVSMYWDATEESGYDILPNAIFWELEADGSYHEVHRLPVRSVMFAPDGSYFLTSKNGQIQLWGVPASIASGD